MSMADLTAAIAGGGGPPGAGPGGAPPDDTGGGQEQYQTSLDALDGAEEAMHAYIQLEPDEVDRAAGSSVLQGILKLKAKDQKDKQAGNMSSLARALGQGPAGGPMAGGGGPYGG